MALFQSCEETRKGDARFIAGIIINSAHHSCLSLTWLPRVLSMQHLQYSPLGLPLATFAVCKTFNIYCANICKICCSGLFHFVALRSPHKIQSFMKSWPASTGYRIVLLRWILSLGYIRACLPDEDIFHISLVLRNRYGLCKPGNWHVVVIFVGST